MTILVLDGNENQAVACVRSLARTGHRVEVGADTKCHARAPRHIRNTPKRVSGIGALRQAESESASASRVFAGSRILNTCCL